MKELTNSEQVEITGGGLWPDSFTQAAVRGARIASAWVGAAGGYVVAAVTTAAVEGYE